MAKELVSAVIVSRGNVDLRPIVRRLSCFAEVVVWDNSRERDLKVFGRYAALDRTKYETIYVQDDDCLIDARRLWREYRPGELLCNVQEGHYRQHYANIGVSLVGWGAIFDRRMVDFGPYLAKWPADDLFHRECDRVFTWLNRARTRVVDIGFRQLPQAFAKDRMGREDRHVADLREICRRLSALE